MRVVSSLSKTCEQRYKFHNVKPKSNMQNYTYPVQCVIENKNNAKVLSTHHAVNL